MLGRWWFVTQIGEIPLQHVDAFDQAGDGFGHRIGEQVVVEVYAADVLLMRSRSAAGKAVDDASRHTDHGAIGRDVFADHRVGSDTNTLADGDRAENLCHGANHDVDALLGVYDNLLAGALDDLPQYYAMLLGIVQQEPDPLLLTLALEQLWYVYEVLLDAAQRGVWKAPAGQDASLVGVRELVYKMTDGENGRVNPLGVNALRAFPVTGNVAWGARTTEGADRLASEWKYIPVRRLALFIEETLFRGTQWVVFEPNDEPLWAQIRLNVGAFLQDLFRQGAFQGSSPRDAFFVRCDRTTTTPSDIDRGVVNIHVGFAPLKPAEFVVIRIQQIAGQSAGV